MIILKVVLKIKGVDLMLKIGAHMGISEGLKNVPENSIKIGANSFQIFVHSPRTWSIKKPNNTDIDLFKEEVLKYKINKENILVHSGYLINLASPKEDTWNKSMTLMNEELRITNLLNIKYYNFHPGSHLGNGEEYGIDKISKSLDEILKNFENDDIFILLENVAPKGNNLGYSMKQLGEIINRCAFKNKLGITYDTCHGFDSGYDIRDKDDTLRLIDEINEYIGIEKLKMIHLNDSKFDLNAKKDRHEIIGKGFIGDEGFKNFLSFDEFLKIPLLLETPGDDSAHSKDISHIKNLLNLN
jgi:deoxyribonuclease-4